MLHIFLTSLEICDIVHRISFPKVAPNQKLVPLVLRGISDSD